MTYCRARLIARPAAIGVLDVLCQLTAGHPGSHVATAEIGGTVITIAWHEEKRRTWRDVVREIWQKR